MTSKQAPAAAVLILTSLFPLLGWSANLAEQRELLHARRFLAENRPELAVAQCRQFRERFPATAAGDLALDLEGRAWLTLERPAEALTAYQTLARRHAASPLAPAALLAVGDCQLSLGRALDAVRSWQRVSELHPQAPEAITGLLRAEEHTPRAERDSRQELLRRAVELDPEGEPGLEARRRWAALLLEMDDTDTALRLLDGIVAVAPPGPVQLSALGELSRLLLEGQRPEEALRVLARRVDDYEESPWRGRLWLELAWRRLDQGLAPAAERGLRAALDLEDPRLDPPAVGDSLRLLLTDALITQGRPDAAIAVWEEAPRLTVPALARQGWCHAQLGDSSRAALAWAAAAESLAVVGYGGPRRLLACALAELAACQEASGLTAMPWERLADLAIQVPPGAPEAAPLAAALIRQGMPEAANPLLSAQDDPPFQADRRGLLRLRQAKALRQRDRAQELARIFRERWSASPLLPEVDELSPPRGPRHPSDLDKLRASWRDEDPDPEDLRARIDALEELRRAADAGASEVAGELALAWNRLRAALAEQGRAAGTQAECARMCIAWADSVRDPGAELLLARADSHETLGERGAARTLWLRLFREHAGHAAAVTAARRLIPLADPDGLVRAELAERLEGAWTWHPDAPSLLQELAVAERREGRPTVALAVCERLLAERALRRSPLPFRREAGEAGLLDQTARCQEVLGRRDEARRRWLEATAVAGADTLLRRRILLRLARSWHADERNEQAAEACRQVLDLGGEDAEATAAARLLAAMATAEGRHGEALEWLERLDPARGDAALRAQWTCALYRAGRAEQGRAEFQRLLRQAGKAGEDTLKAVVNLAKGLALLEGGDPAQAVKAFTFILTELPATSQAPAAQLATGRALLAQGDANKALRAFAEAERRWPKSAEAAAAAGERARIAESAGDAAGALAAWGQAVERSRGRARREALGSLADAAGRLRRPTAQREALARYRDEYPDAPDILARRIEEARVIGLDGEAAAGRSALRALQSACADELAAQVQFHLGEVAEAEGDLAGAALEYEKVAHLDPPGGMDWGAGALFAAAGCWQGLGRLEEARRTLETVIGAQGADSGHGRRARAELEALERRERGAGRRP